MSKRSDHLLGRITGAEHDDIEMRKACIAGTLRYADALAAAGYRVGLDALTTLRETLTLSDEHAR